MLSPSTAAAGFPPDFTSLYEDHVEFVWRSLLRLGVLPSDLEDATQETFVVVYRRRHEFEGRCSMRTWLFAIARRVAFRHRRSEQRKRRKLEAFARRPDPAPLEVDDWVDQRRACTLVGVFLESLPPHLRRAFVLGAIEGLSRREVGEALGINPNTAYSRLAAARRAFAQWFETADGSEPAERLLRSVGRPREETRNRMAGCMLALAGKPWGAASLTGAGSSAGLGITGSKLLGGVIAVVASVTVGMGVHALGAPTRSPDPVVATAPIDRDPETDRPEHRAANATPESVETQPYESAPSPALLARLRDDARAVQPEPRRAVSPPEASGSRQEQPARDEAASLKHEKDIIENVHRALAAEDFDDALASLNEHQRLFPDGRLADVRRAQRAIVLCRSGNLAQGRAEGRLLLRGRSSAYAAKIADACGIAAPSDDAASP